METKVHLASIDDCFAFFLNIKDQASCRCQLWSFVSFYQKTAKHTETQDYKRFSVLVLLQEGKN